ncbi:hypothetical protein BE04_07825 [Sorangium cellulosum]|uniref:AAA+ ATPase domain-containing protein n=1 Tax=Sorangium cellulosum TaxID=56 RepID=A0A150P9J9_SORCE|nr:hypothetical protein BE04_07825 [Sorangium cellulosum]
MTYVPIFDWELLHRTRGPRSDGAVAYRYHRDLELAVNVALAAGRPLLLRGKPGSGKSTLAADVAWKLERRFYAHVVTSKTEAQDLQWRFDAVGRLSFATSGERMPATESFVTPGVLWWAFDPSSAAKHGTGAPARRPWGDEGRHAVVLLDEIDKAEPDVPNDLLAVLDRREFYVQETTTQVKAPENLEVLLVITTNDERDMPDAFLRRCITYELPAPEDTELEAIAKLHFPAMQDSLITRVRELFETLGVEATSQNRRRPSTAELIDALRACTKLGIASKDDAAWEEIARASMWKHGKPKSGAAAKSGAVKG